MTKGAPDTPSTLDALPLPTSERMLRGIRTAVSEIDVTGRPDLRHLAAILDIVVSNLIVREDTAPYGPIYADIAALVKARAADAEGVSTELKARAAALEMHLPNGLSFDAIQRWINEGLGCLNDLARATPDATAPASREFLAKAEAIEAAFYAASLRPIVNPAPPAEAAPITKNGFEAYLLEKFPGR
ncbi:MAG: hypothetical protein ABWZ40_11880 [Caulobacterales bacterium]